jgi:RNA polymerase sigma-70 factor (ECF subfamily)
MTEDQSFASLVRKLRAGDDEAAAELVRRYEPAIRRSVRLRLRDPRLRRLLDSVDICQSVMASFFVRAASGQYDDLDQPGRLVALLTTMARNKLASQARKAEVGRRDPRLPSLGSEKGAEVPDRQPSPSRCLASRDLLQVVYRQLSEEEQQLVERRGQGQRWDEIAAELGNTPEALRKKLTRALDRAVSDLGLEGSFDD